MIQSIALRAGALALVTAAALTGCGGGGSAADAGGDVQSGADVQSGTDVQSPGNDTGANSALVGTWGTSTCLAPDTSMCDFAVTFGANGEYSNTSRFVKDAASTTGFPGCTITLVATGYTYTSTATTVSVAQGAMPAQTTMRTGCMNASDDQPTAMPSPDFAPASYTYTDQPYAISGSQLTLGGAGGLVLTRR